jgi:hypothetical protein
MVIKYVLTVSEYGFTHVFLTVGANASTPIPVTIIVEINAWSRKSHSGIAKNAEIKR